jgi:hypothetical protein
MYNHTTVLIHWNQPGTFFQEFRWKILEPPTDLTQNNYHLFWAQKQHLEGNRFETDDDMETLVKKWLKEQAKSSTNTG